MNVHDDRAATAPLAFVIAGALIIGVIATALMTTNDIATPSNTGASVSANRQAQAHGLVQLMLDTPGYTPAGAWDSADCGEAPWDILECPELGATGRLGLQHAKVPYLDLTKFRNLKSAPFAADGADGFVNYEEARASMGLTDSGLDFHIRAYPTLQAVQDRLNCNPPETCKDPNLRVTYLGNLQEEVTAPSIYSASCKKSPAADKAWRFSVRVTNTGDTETQFQGMFDLEWGNKRLSRTDQTGLVAAGETKELWVDVENQDFVACSPSTEVTVNLYDPSRRLTPNNSDPFTGSDLAVDTSTVPAAANQEFYVELNHMHYAPGDAIQVSYRGATQGEVLHWEVHEGLVPGNLVTCFLGSECKGDHPVPSNNQNEHYFTIAEGLHEAVYTLLVTHESGIVSTQRILVTPADVGDFSEVEGPTMDPAIQEEITYIHQLIKNFCPASFDDPAASELDGWDADRWTEVCGDFRPAGIEDTSGGAQGQQDGDVFWDDKSLMTDELCKRLQYVHTNGNCQQGNEARLDITNVLVVGSNVDHSAMTSGGFKWPLQAWVEAGGTIIVFGSPETSTQWLQPIFNVGEQSSSGELSAPDNTHPLLAVPNQLDYNSYDNQGKSWTYTANSDELFTDIVKQGDDPITAISDPGAFGLGNVMISTWLPYDLYDDAVPGEGLAIMDNFLTHAYRDMFLDYGPPIPAQQEAIPALGRSQICHTLNEDILADPLRLRQCDDPDLDGLGLIDMDIAVFVFRG